MGILKFDMTDVEPGQDFDTPIPKGIYKMRINEIEDGESGRDGRPMLTVELEVIEGDWKGRRLWDYVKYQDDTSQWKYRQLLEALQLVGESGKQTGQFDPNKYTGTVLVVKVKHENDDEYGLQAKVGSLSPLPDAEQEEAAEEPEAEAETGGEEEEEITAASVREMDLEELKDLISEQEIEGIRVTKKSKAEKVQDKVIEALELVDVIEDPEDWDGLAELDVEAMEAYVEQEELDIDTEEMDEDELRAAIAEELEIEVPEEENEENGTPDFSEMSLKELKATCQEQGLETKGGKKGMIKRLEKAAAANGSGSDPF